MLNRAVLAPIPNASVTRATAEKPGLLQSTRNAYRRSMVNALITIHSCLWNTPAQDCPPELYDSAAVLFEYSAGVRTGAMATAVQPILFGLAFMLASWIDSRLIRRCCAG